MMSMNEQRDVDEMLTWLGQQPWSTGNIGMIGRSYDGTTPFMGAAFGNPYLKTIVPISGVPDIGDLMFSNGTSEFRGPIMHSVVYWAGFGPTAQGPETTPDHLCDEFVEGAWVGAATYATGDQSVYGLSDYWDERRLHERVLENYNGSAWVIHGMQDWNVNPAQVVPYVNQMMDAGIKTKVWLGQWAHHYPDRNDEHTNTRMDWAEMLLRWFDSELKGIDVDTGPIVEVEDHRHDWWVLDRYPPEVDYQRLYLNPDGLGQSPSGDGMDIALNPLGEQTLSSISLTSDPLEGPFRLSGLTRLKLEVTPTVPTGGNVYAQLLDVYPDGRTQWLGQGWINLAYYEGGRERQDLTPGQSVVAKIQFEPLEGTIPDGHRLRLIIDHEVTNNRGDSIARPEATGFIVHYGENSFLELPVHHDFTRSPYRV
jgi:predicted acyl esterase